MRSIGIDFKPYVDKCLMKIDASRPMAYGLEMHLIAMHRPIDEFEPAIVIIDPITNLINAGTPKDVQLMLTRLIDYLKLKKITTLCTSLVENESTEQTSAQGISSLMDTWINLRFFESNSERNRGISAIKSRGMKHDNQIREFLLTDNGIEIQDVYLGHSGGLLMGSARVSQENEEKAEVLAQNQTMERKKRELENKLKTLTANIASFQSEFETIEEELGMLNSEEELKIQTTFKDKN